MIDDYAEECGGKENYEPLREVLLLLNNNVDCFSSLNDENLMIY